MPGRQNVLAVDKLSIKFKLQILLTDSNIYLGSGSMRAQAATRKLQFVNLIYPARDDGRDI